MLKFTYTENGFNLERLASSVDELVARRVILAMRVGEGIVVEPTSASFLLPADLPGLKGLETQTRRDRNEAIALCIADADYVEVSLHGTWIAANSETAEGVFVTAIGELSEFYLIDLWEQAQTKISLLEEVD
ncbi:MAG: hypothetical protein D6680_14140 [Cyanobacteria bacterium J007]|nr:MAG: hypothetical protein D6680_14140 [Cyanobacteria bacterium J007]